MYASFSPTPQSGCVRQILAACGILDSRAISLAISRLAMHEEPPPYAALFQELIVESIAYLLRRHPRNLRSLFKSHDKGSFGYLTLTQFSCMLETVCHLHSHDLQYLIASLDPGGTGRIHYSQLYHRLFETSTVANLRHLQLSASNRTIRCGTLVPFFLHVAKPYILVYSNVIVVTRHGVRLPLKPFPAVSSIIRSIPL
jgi:hypothetical protein